MIQTRAMIHRPSGLAPSALAGRTARMLALGTLLIVPALSIAPGDAVAHDVVTARLTKSDCARLVKHVPAPDVAYRPGVDVRGRPVTPADVDGGVSIAVPETIEIPIKVDLQDRFGLPANSD
ncbi:MAG: hypothetical protein D6826_06185, partial [Alphaproteobacteria bacterium]